MACTTSSTADSFATRRRREWQLPHIEKLLETNALLLQVYAESASTLDRDVDREVAAELATYITGRLGGAAGGYCGSEDDTTVYADTSATASAALLSASSALNDQELGRTALEQLERVLLTSYRPGKGIAHCTDGASRVAGLLADYVAVIHALLDAHQVSDAEPYEMLAQELAHYVLQTMWDGRSGGLLRSDARAGRAGAAAEPAQAVCRQLRSGACLCPAGARIVRRRLPLVCGRRDPSRWRRSPQPRDRWPPTTCWRSASSRPSDTLPDFTRSFVPTSSIDALRNIATQLRIDSIRSTSQAGSGHPTSCMSAADVVAALFFAEMRYDPQAPKNPDNDRFVLSKGHAAPILYAAWAEAGLFPRDELLKLRPSIRIWKGIRRRACRSWMSRPVRSARAFARRSASRANARLIGSAYRTYVLLGDGESAEGSVWEAADIGAAQKLDNLCAIVDVNALGQSRPTQFGHNMDELRGDGPPSGGRAWSSTATTCRRFSTP